MGNGSESAHWLLLRQLPYLFKNHGRRGCHGNQESQREGGHLCLEWNGRRSGSGSPTPSRRFSLLDGCREGNKSHSASKKTPVTQKIGSIPSDHMTWVGKKSTAAPPPSARVRFSSACSTLRENPASVSRCWLPHKSAPPRFLSPRLPSNAADKSDAPASPSGAVQERIAGVNSPGRSPPWLPGSLPGGHPSARLPGRRRSHPRPERPRPSPPLPLRPAPGEKDPGEEPRLHGDPPCRRGRPTLNTQKSIRRLRGIYHPSAAVWIAWKHLRYIYIYAPMQ